MEKFNKLIQKIIKKIPTLVCTTSEVCDYDELSYFNNNVEIGDDTHREEYVVSLKSSVPILEPITQICDKFQFIKRSSGDDVHIWTKGKRTITLHSESTELEITREYRKV